MGAFGDAAVTGKPVGGDLREGKPTPLMARAVEAASAGAGRGARARRHACTSPTHDVARVQQVIVDTGALADLEATIAALDRRGGGGHRTRADPAQARDELVALAAYVASDRSDQSASVHRAAGLTLPRPRRPRRRRPRATAGGRCAATVIGSSSPECSTASRANSVA